MLKSVIAAAAAIGLMASPVAAAGPAPVPAEEVVDGQPLFDSYASPLIVFVLIVALGTGLALLIDTGGDNDRPSSP
jgi:hypothetical protein